MVVVDARMVRVTDPALADVRRVAVTVFQPGASVPVDRAVLWCVPGGGMTRRYFDLEVDGYSMARHLAELGHVVISVDPPGVGDSDVPGDGWALLPEVIADVLEAVRVQLGAELGLAERIEIGVGHSAGGLLLARQQARHRGFHAVALLGVSGGGLPDVTTPDEMAYAHDEGRLAPALVDLAKARFGEPLPVMARGSSERLVGHEMDSHVHEALVRTRAPLLALVGTMSLIPGSSASAFEAIDVPVFLGVGDADIAGPPHRIPRQFPRSRDVTLVVVRSGHNHNVAPGRHLLWDRLSQWTTVVG